MIINERSTFFFLFHKSSFQTDISINILIHVTVHNMICLVALVTFMKKSSRRTLSCSLKKSQFFVRKMMTLKMRLKSVVVISVSTWDCECYFMVISEFTFPIKNHKNCIERLITFRKKI